MMHLGPILGAADSKRLIAVYIPRECELTVSRTDGRVISRDLTPPSHASDEIYRETLRRLSLPLGGRDVMVVMKYALPTKDILAALL